MKDYIKTKLNTIFNAYQMERARIIDMTEHTDDPGNTELAIAFIPLMKEDDSNYTSEEWSLKYEEAIDGTDALAAKLREAFDSAGRSEETILSYQNNEYLIIFNFNQ